MPSSGLLALISSLAMALAAPGLALASPPAKAPPAQRSFALLSLEVVGQSAGELRGVVDRSLTQSFKTAGVQVIAYKEVAAILAPTPELTACTSPSCLTRISQLVGTRELVRAHLVASGATYDLELDLLSAGAAANPVARIERHCSVCTVGDLSDLSARAAAALASGEGRTGGGVSVEIHCRPTGAQLTIDDQPRGAAPFEGTLTRGRHRIVATLDGHLAAVKVIDIDPSGGVRHVELILAPTGVVDSARRPYRAWKWVAAGGAAALLVGSVALLAVNGDGTCDSGRDSCPRVYSTGTVGILGLAMGLAAGGASAWMFVRDHRDGRERR